MIGVYILDDKDIRLSYFSWIQTFRRLHSLLAKLKQTPGGQKCLRIDIMHRPCIQTVRNTECNSIVFLKSKNIHQCLYIGGICVQYK